MATAAGAVAGACALSIWKGWDDVERACGWKRSISTSFPALAIGFEVWGEIKSFQVIFDSRGTLIGKPNSAKSYEHTVNNKTRDNPQLGALRLSVQQVNSQAEKS